MEIVINHKEYKIKNWYADKNTDMIMLQADNTLSIENNLIIEKETEKAFLLKTSSGYTFWIPKSVLESNEFIPEKIMISFYQDFKDGKQTLDEFKNQFSRIFREIGEEKILNELNSIQV